MTKVPLTFTANEDNSSVSLVCFEYEQYDVCNSWCKFEYSMTGKDDWSDYATGQVVPLNKDETVYFRAKQGNVDGNPNLNGLTQYEDYGDKNYFISKYHYFVMEGSLKADGNIQFLLENTGTKMDVPDWCYYGLFSDYSLNGNISLIQAPLLPATTLAYGCYQEMFSNCTNLTQAPALPATTLAESCYNSMFFGCSSLNNININFSAWNPSSATNSWVNSVASEGTFTCPETLPEERGSRRIPEGWTIVHK